MSTEELCAHKFDFSAELRDIADRGFTEDRVIPDYRGDNFQRVAQARAILADGIYGSVDGIVAHIRDQSRCAADLHKSTYARPNFGRVPEVPSGVRLRDFCV